MEDERDVRELLRRFLERTSCLVLTAATGAEALRLLDSSAPDLVDVEAVAESLLAGSQRHLAAFDRQP